MAVVAATTSHVSMVVLKPCGDESTTQVADFAGAGPPASWKATMISKLVTDKACGPTTDADTGVAVGWVVQVHVPAEGGTAMPGVDWAIVGCATPSSAVPRFTLTYTTV